MNSVKQEGTSCSACSHSLVRKRGAYRILVRLNKVWLACSVINSSRTLSKMKSQVSAAFVPPVTRKKLSWTVDGKEFGDGGLSQVCWSAWKEIINFAWFIQLAVSSYSVLVLTMIAAYESAVPVVLVGLPGASSLQVVVWSAFPFRAAQWRKKTLLAPLVVPKNKGSSPGVQKPINTLSQDFFLTPSNITLAVLMLLSSEGSRGGRRTGACMLGDGVC